MAIICPTVTAFTEHEYKERLLQLMPFAERIHIDLMDGEFAPTKSPDLGYVWWPHELETVDIHLMYQNPMEHLARLIELKPHMVIVHNEASVHHMHFAAELHKAGIKAGLAILHDTPIEWAYQIMHSFDHVLVFSGDLGHQGGQADLGLLDKVRKIREHHPEAEIGWDGGINADNIAELAAGGVDVLNVGGFIAKSSDPHAAYGTLVTALKH
ncbi:MAG: rpe [Candidatus Saccharibacteria bacterium]|nr:rpe [Candidatus Saccharibacteria bacterium]